MKLVASNLLIGLLVMISLNVISAQDDVDKATDIDETDTEKTEAAAAKFEAAVADAGEFKPESSKPSSPKLKKEYIKASDLGLNDILSTSFIRVINIFLNFFFEQGKKVGENLRQTSEPLGDKFLDTLDSIADMFTAFPTSVDNIVKMLKNLQVALEKMDELLAEVNRQDISPILKPIVNQLRLGLTACIPALAAVTKAVQVVG